MAIHAKPSRRVSSSEFVQRQGLWRLCSRACLSCECASSLALVFGVPRSGHRPNHLHLHRRPRLPRRRHPQRRHPQRRRVHLQRHSFRCNLPRRSLRLHSPRPNPSQWCNPRPSRHPRHPQIRPTRSLHRNPLRRRSLRLHRNQPTPLPPLPAAMRAMRGRRATPRRLPRRKNRVLRAAASPTSRCASIP